jgi:hypothetical protein
MIFVDDLDCLGFARSVGIEQVLGLLLVLVQGGAKRQWFEIHYDLYCAATSGASPSHRQIKWTAARVLFEMGITLFPCACVPARSVMLPREWVARTCAFEVRATSYRCHPR